MSQTKVNCPNCQKDVIWQAQSEYRPFCSKRCQLIDLGEWADENHKIAGKPGFADITLETDIEDIEAMLQQQESGDSFFKE
jgi:endogenous inhibitor of DNA gyrase (YacG/DUF329 family)